MQKTDADYVADMKRFYAKNHEENNDPTVTCIVDPSASSFIAALRREDVFKVRKGNNDVENGLRETATALEQGYIKVSATCTNWATEAGGYVWDSNSQRDAPVKVDDHLMDAMRYHVKTNRLALPKEEYRGVFG